MAIKVSQAELVKQLAAQVAGWVADGYQIGLFGNDWVPGDEDTIEAVEPCTFGGYEGLRALIDWESPEWDEGRAKVSHPPVVWECDGSASGTIYGYYVVDGEGALAWAERRSDGEASVGLDGQTYSVTPRYSRKSEF